MDGELSEPPFAYTTRSARAHLCPYHQSNQTQTSYVLENSSWVSFSYLESTMATTLSPRKGSTWVCLNLRADTLRSNNMSNSPYVRPLGSGRRKKIQTTQRKQVPHQKKPDFAPQFQAVG